MNLASILERSARAYGDRPAVVDGDRVTSFRELDRRANRFARGMAERGLGAGDRVALLLGNRLEWFDATFGLLKQGLVRSYVNPRSAPPEIAYQLEDSGASLLVVSEDLAPLVSAVTLPAGVELMVTGAGYEDWLGRFDPSADLLVGGDDDLAALMYTSGTTGRPKGAMQTHRNWLASTQAQLLELDLRRDDVLLHVGPMSHASGGTVYPLLFRGGLQVVHRGFDPVAMLEAIPRHQVTLLMMVPTMLYFLLDVLDAHPLELSSLRTIMYGGSPMAPERLERCLAKLGPVFVQSYGQTEALGGETFLHKDQHTPGNPRLLSAGRPTLHVEMKVVDDEGREVAPGELGEVLVRGPHVMAGYWNRPEATAEVLDVEGWFHSSDVGRFDDEGYLFIVDRKADMIVSGGFNVYPREVEDVLLERPEVLEAAVIAVPDERFGESVKAVVRLRDGAAIDPETLRSHCRDRLAGFKVPRSIDIVSAEIPKNPNGKPLRRLVREPFWVGRDRRVG